MKGFQMREIEKDSEIKRQTGSYRERQKKGHTQRETDRGRQIEREIQKETENEQFEELLNMKGF